MLFVNKPNPYSMPGACVMIPGRTSDEVGFVDTTTELDGISGPIHIYLSATGLRRAAQQFKQLRLVDAGKLESVEAQLAEVLAQRDAAVERVDELEAIQDRIAGLKKAGFTVQKVQGRPKKVSEDE